MRNHSLFAFTLCVSLALDAPVALADAKPKAGVASNAPAARPRPRVPQFPADVKARGDRLWNAASPAVKAWSNQNAPGIAKGAGDPEALAHAAVQARWPNLRSAATDALTFLVIYEAAKNLQADVKNKLDSMSELGETESLRLQMAMDRLSKMMTTLSNLLKKISDTADGIVQNLK
jgi:hypothetical protein